ncbi:MAG: hypothetical protein RR654_03530 [Oscillospiraceae bacterium]
MLAECIAVLAITLCMTAIFIRSGHRDYAASLLPLLIVPGGHIFVWVLLKLFSNIIPNLPILICSSFADIASLAISCLLIFFFSGKKLYLVILSGYNIILTCAFVFQTLVPTPK